MALGTEASRPPSSSRNHVPTPVHPEADAVEVEPLQLAPNDHPPVLEPDLDATDTDSALGTDAPSSTGSITPSILDFCIFWGRSYHAPTGRAHYWASNDEKQCDFLDILHRVFYLVHQDRLFRAPITPERTKRVLDVGTGTGIWAIDFADQFPDAQVTGTDISPIQPEMVPPNLRFEIEDCTLPWTFGDDVFDYVHIRWLFGSIPDWNKLFEQAYRCLKPGGYVESFEPDVEIRSDDDTVLKNSAMGQWADIFVKAGEKMGQPFTVYSDGLQKEGMKAAGFVDIEEAEVKTPLGGWPGDVREREIGKFQMKAMDNDMKGMIEYLAGEQLQWTLEKIHVFDALFRSEMKSRSIHAYYRQRVVWARKPVA